MKFLPDYSFYKEGYEFSHNVAPLYFTLFGIFPLIVSIMLIAEGLWIIPFCYFSVWSWGCIRWYVLPLMISKEDKEIGKSFTAIKYMNRLKRIHGHSTIKKVIKQALVKSIQGSEASNTRNGEYLSRETIDKVEEAFTLIEKTCEDDGLNDLQYAIDAYKEVSGEKSVDFLKEPRRMGSCEDGQKMNGRAFHAS